MRGLVRCRETADEVVQEAFLRTYENRDTLQIPRAFLFSIAHNLAADIRRRQRFIAPDADATLDDSCLAVEYARPEDLLIADEASRLLKEAIDLLPPQCRIVFTLKLFHGYSYREISKELDLAEKTVEKHVARGILRTHGYMRARYSVDRSRSEFVGC